MTATTLAAGGGPVDDDRPGRAFASSDSPGILRLSEKLQQMGGIETQVLQPIDYQPENRAFGKVLSLDPLLEIAQQLRAADSERKMAAAALAATEAAYRRIDGLFHDSAIARIKVEQSRMDWISAGARYDQATANVEAIHARAVQAWGEVLTGWATDPHGPEFSRFVQHKSALLSVSLPAGETLPDGTRTAFVHRGFDRSDAAPAELISVAPVTGERSQGESYFFRTAAGPFRTGMHLSVRIPVPGPSRRGVEIPGRSLVWRDGQPWIYLKIAPDSFRRHPVRSALDLGDRWFIPGVGNANAEIVVNGGQVLLSQEFHWQIPDEDDD